MRNLHFLDQWRMEARHIFGSNGDYSFGCFCIPSPIDKAPMVIIATTQEGWDHVSASRKNRTPNWPEMEHVRHLFFHDSETVMQLHVPPAQHVNYHPYCLHLWRPQTVEIPRPPSWMVGPLGEQGSPLTPAKAGAPGRIRVMRAG